MIEHSASYPPPPSQPFVEDTAEQPTHLRLPSLCTGLVAIVFFASAIGKVLAPAPTLGVISELLTLDSRLAWAVFISLLVVEFALAAWLVVGVSRNIAAAAAGLFLLGVSAGVVGLLLKGSTSQCGCGLPTWASDPRTGQIVALTRNAVLFFLVSATLAGALVHGDVPTTGDKE